MQSFFCCVATLVRTRLALLTYSVFLLLTIGGLADAYAVTLIANCLVSLLPDRLTALVSDVARHLRGHWGQSKAIVHALLETTEWCDWQLKSTSSCLRDLHGVLSTMRVVSRGTSSEWREHAWLGCHEIGLEGFEAG